MKRSLVKGTAYAAIAALSIQGFSFAAAADENGNVEGTLGFARLSQEDAYVNVRAEASTESGEVIGILRNGDSAVIESVEDDGWYRIRSGDVEGYVAARLIATGAEADEIASERAYTYAKVNAVSLNVRTDSSQEAEVIDTLAQGAEAEVIEDYDGGAFVKVCVGTDTYGYVSADYVELVTDYPTGLTLEQIEAQENAAQSAQEQTWTAEDPQYSDAQTASETYTDSSDADTGYTDTGYTDTGYTDTGSTDTGYTDDSSVSYTDQSSQTYEDASAQTVQSTDSGQSSQTQTAASEEPAASTASASGSAIASYACQFAGIPYVWGGSSLTSGVDCSGFTMAVFSHFGISLPHFAASQYGCGTPVSLSDLVPGDLVFYNGSSGSIEHVAIYVGGGSIIHARGTGYGVCYSSLNYDTPDAACRIV